MGSSRAGHWKQLGKRAPRRALCYTQTIPVPNTASDRLPTHALYIKRSLRSIAKKKLSSLETSILQHLNAESEEDAATGARVPALIRASSKVTRKARGTGREMLPSPDVLPKPHTRCLSETWRPLRKDLFISLPTDRSQRTGMSGG